MRRSIFVTLSVLVLLSLALSACTPAATQTVVPTTAATKAMQPTTAATDVEQPTAAAPTEAGVTPTASPMTDGITLPEIDPAALNGDIYAAGSSTVYPLIEAVAENFNADGFEGNGSIKIDSVGTGGGFERFCSTGETDIANASRAIKDSETELCAALKPARTPIEFRVGTDAIAIVVSSENDFLTDVTLEQLAAIFSTATNWSDVDPSWPAEPIQRFTPGTDSGTFDFFVETVIQKPQKIEKLDDAKKVVLDAANLQTSEDDNVLVQGVEGSPYAVAYFGFAYYQNEAANLKAISVNGVEPNAETAESGEYALSRPLFLYSDAAVLNDKPQVAAFINYFLTNVNDLILDVGYFPASQDALDVAKQNWLNAMP